MDDADFPLAREAPEQLRQLPGECGPVAAWQLLTYLGICAPVDRILSASRYSRDLGVFCIGLAVAVAEMGPRVWFFSDPDIHPSPTELLLYEQATELGIEMLPGADLNTLEQTMASSRRRAAAILLFEANRESAHFTPYLGLYEGEPILPNEGDTLSADTLETRRSAPGVLRQALVAAKAS